MCIIVELTSQSRCTSNCSCIINTFSFRLLCGISIMEIVIFFPVVLLINLSDLLRCLEKNPREQGESPIPNLLSLGAMTYFQGLGSRKLEDSYLNVYREISITALLSIFRRLVVLCFVIILRFIYFASV